MENYCLPDDHKNGSLCRSTTIICIYLRRDGLYVLSEYRVLISIEELCSQLIIYRHKRAKEKRKLKKQLKVDSRLNPCLYVLIPNKIFFSSKLLFDTLDHRTHHPNHHKPPPERLCKNHLKDKNINACRSMK